MSERARRAEASFGLMALGIFVVKICAGLALLACGFHNVSDDDYARTVIAESFAHAPKLDPSGTSWLPFPFWVTGTAMIAFGRSLAVARVVAVLCGAVAPCLVFAALRARGVSRAAPIAVAAFLAPWLAVLSVATVPEALTAGLASAGVIALSCKEKITRRDLFFAAALFFACLSRYDAWPMAGAAAIVVVLRARANAELRKGAWIAGIAIAAPVAWMLWNRVAHGDAFHFFARVSKFRAAGESDVPIATKALFYPRALAVDAPDILVAIVVALAAVTISRQARARWGPALIACAATFVFLVVGSLGDGAPTHHPARALVIMAPVLYTAGLDGMRTVLAPRLQNTIARRATGAAAIALVSVSFFVQRQMTRDLLRDGDRAREVDLGARLHAEDAARVVIATCEGRYDHLAIIASFGAPERVTIRSGESLVSARLAPPNPVILGETCVSTVLEPARGR